MQGWVVVGGNYDDVDVWYVCWGCGRGIGGDDYCVSMCVDGLIENGLVYVFVVQGIV